MTVGYFCAIAVALVFMFYMDGDMGVLMLAFLLLMPIISLCMTLWVRRSLTVSLELPDTAGKQQPLTAVIVLQKRTRLPLPFLRMNLRTDAHFHPLNPDAEALPPEPLLTGSALRDAAAARKWRKQKRAQLVPDTLPLCLSMGIRDTARYQIRLTGRFCGSGTVSLSDVRLSDYLAMFTFSLPLTDQGSVLLTPEIPELKPSSELFRSVTTAVAAADDESDATPTASASSVPGYEHRDYLAGDSLKRINWKLSSKRHKLLVRQDEPVSLARLSVVLDFRRDSRISDMERNLANEEILIETALGFLMLCARNGYPCTLHYADQNGAWSMLPIDDGGLLATEAINLLRGGFRSADRLAALPLLPPQLTQEAGAVLLHFTTIADGETAAMLEHVPSEVYTIVPESRAANAVLPRDGSLWLATANRQLAKS